MDLDIAEQGRESPSEPFEVLTPPCPHHDPVGVNGPVVAAVTLAGADGAEETVLGEEPHD